MKLDKFIIIFLIIALIIGIAGYFGIRKLKNNFVSEEIKEYTPQEEITDDQTKKTMINLYFYNNETGKIETEARFINSIELIDNPYLKLVQMLIDGPKSEKLKSLMPDGVQVITAKLESNCVILDMSIEMLNYTEDKDLKDKMINSIVNTLTELTEVESVKITINGDKNQEFDEEYFRK